MVELLAPAGSREAFEAALKGGADAVYMAGTRFGARALAQNFTTAEYIDCLNIAHIQGKRIYLTLNTLIKEREWDEVYDYLNPLYQNGLDGVIIQDLGLIAYLRDEFPLLPVHASTQMAVTSGKGARLLKQWGVSRIVPARELSLDEIVQLKQESGLEVESFIHGAMCYSYSGQCLFSAMLGGRSGNRGRCAGTCRLPYKMLLPQGNSESSIQYPLSLKDMCTIGILPKLIDGGIDSFKIEGRQKSPLYTYGVTSIYRRYIDAYLEKGSISLAPRDMEVLNNLYIRSEITEGYYFCRSGKNMVTLKDSSYNGADRDFGDLEQELKERKIKRPVKLRGRFKPDTPMELTCLLKAKEQEYIVTAVGDICQRAQSRPVTMEELKKRIGKLGDTPFKAESIDIELEGDIFVPLGAVNELRRRCLEELEKKLVDCHSRPVSGKSRKMPVNCPIDKNVSAVKADSLNFIVSVLDMNQLQAIGEYSRDIAIAIIPYDLIFNGDTGLKEIQQLLGQSVELYISLPRIYRLEENQSIMSYMKSFEKLLRNNPHTGIMVENLEQLMYIQEAGLDNKLASDYFLYCSNSHAVDFLKKYVDNVSNSPELSIHQLREVGEKDMWINLYGHCPLMVTANCLKKTAGQCSIGNYGSTVLLKDRYGKKHFCISNCTHCFNIIYNAVPTSGHKYIKRLSDFGYHNMRIDFSVENDGEVRQIMDYYISCREGRETVFPVEYTGGLMEKGSI